MKSVYLYYHSHVIFLPQVAQENNYNYSPVIGEELTLLNPSQIGQALPTLYMLSSCQLP